jgi:YbbR domain-containing protein
MDVRKLLLENWPIKLTSFLLSLTIWFYVTSKGKTEMAFTVPLELRNVPQGMAVVGDVPATIEVRLQGQERMLRDMPALKQVVGSVDLGRGKEGDNRIPLSPDDIRRPAGVHVTHLSPSEIVVKLEQLEQRTLRLRPVLLGTPAPGYRVAGLTVRPVRITLEGPASVIRTFSVLQTMPIDVQDAKDPVTVEPKIDYQGKPVKILEQDISVTISIQKERP